MKKIITIALPFLLSVFTAFSEGPQSGPYIVPGGGSTNFNAAFVNSTIAASTVTAPGLVAGNAGGLISGSVIGGNITLTGTQSNLTAGSANVAGTATNVSINGNAVITTTNRSWNRGSWTNILTKLASGSNATIQFETSGLGTANGGLIGGIISALTNQFAVVGAAGDFNSANMVGSSGTPFIASGGTGYNSYQITSPTTNGWGGCVLLTNSAQNFYFSSPSLFYYQPNGVVAWFEYVKGAKGNGSGSFTVTYNNYAGNPVLATLNCNTNVATPAIFAWTNNLGTVPQYANITLAANGITNYIPILRCGITTLSNGIVLSGIGNSSSGWYDLTNVAPGYNYTADNFLNPDVFVLQSIESTNTTGAPSSFYPVFDYCRTNFPSADIVLCGTYAAQNFVIQGSSVENAWIVYMQTNGFGKGAFYSPLGQYPFNTYSNLYNLGLMSDGTHLNAASMIWWGQDFYDWLELKNPTSYGLQITWPSLLTMNNPSNGWALRFSATNNSFYFAP